MGRRRKGRTVKRNAHRPGHGEEDEQVTRAPHSFVVPLGKVSKDVRELAADFRRVMEPFTATKIKARPGNVIKDYVHVAGVLNVSHMIGFTKTELGPYLKVARLPRGPTLTFRVNEYVMARDVRSSLKRQVTYDKQFLHHPLLIMNGFSGDTRDVQLTSSMFQNMFPSINVSQLKLSTVKRCVLLNRDEETGSVEFRHYTIKVVPVGLTKGVKKIVTGKVPNLGRFENMAEFLASKGGQTSESEAEDDDTNKVTLPQAVSSRGNLPDQQSAIRLVELGPRLTLSLVKIEDGLFDGEVLHHSLVSKTDSEVKAIRAVREKKKREKEQRKAEQAKNVQKKADKKVEHKNRSLEGMRRKVKDMENLPDGFKKYKSSDEEEDDDDKEYFRKEVGVEPDKDLFDSGENSRKRRGGGVKDFRFKKKRKTDAKPGKKPPAGDHGKRPKFKMTFKKAGAKKRPPTKKKFASKRK